MLVSWRWCCHSFYGKFWRHDVRQQDLKFHIWQAWCPLVPARRCCVATRRETAAPVPWPQDQIGAVATRRRPFAARTCGCIFFSPCVYFLVGGQTVSNILLQCISRVASMKLWINLRQTGLTETSSNKQMSQEKDWWVGEAGSWHPTKPCRCKDSSTLSISSAAFQRKAGSR